MLSTSTNPPNLGFRCFQFQSSHSSHRKFSIVIRTPTSSLNSSHHYHYDHFRSAPRSLVAYVSSDGGTADAIPQHSASSPSVVGSSSPSSEDGYLTMFIRMLGLDNDPLDREQAVVALWKYSQGGKQRVDGMMQFPGCINLTVNLLRSDSSSTCEAAAGLLRTISSVDLYRDSVAESGAVEEIAALLSCSPLTPEVKEQSMCTLWNLSVDEKFRKKMAESELLPVLIKFLDDEEVKVKEAAGGVLANLALTQSNHKIMVEAGAIPKLAQHLKVAEEGSKGIRKVAKSALLELAKDEFYRILIIEEGLVLVPLVGADAYKSFRPVSHSWPSFPDGTQLERSSSTPSRYGASELLLGLNIQGKSFDLEEAKVHAIVGRTQQQFLARIGAIEIEEGRKLQPESSSNQQYTLLPWIDGVARLVIILELEDVSAISRAALSIADASINEHMRMSFTVAGAVKHLVRLLNYNNENVKLAACHALERLFISNDVCNMVEAEGVVDPLVNALKCKEMPESMIEKTVNILACILDPGKEMRLKFYDGPVNGSANLLSGTSSGDATKGVDEKPYDMKGLKETTREYILDPLLISRLIELMKTTPTLQTKTASILEYITTLNSSMETLINSDIESALHAVFNSRFPQNDEEKGSQRPDLAALEAVEAGLAISATSRLLAKLLESEHFRTSINSSHLIKLLRRVLISNIPVHNKDWVAASLIKLGSYKSELDPIINTEVTLYEKIPRLIEEIESGFSREEQEKAVVELNGVLSGGVVEFSRAVGERGGIDGVVKVVEKGRSKAAVEAGIGVLFNLGMDSENHLAIIAAGAVPVLRKIVLSQGPDWMRALSLLRSLPTQ